MFCRVCGQYAPPETLAVFALEAALKDLHLTPNDRRMIASDVLRAMADDADVAGDRAGDEALRSWASDVWLTTAEGRAEQEADAEDEAQAFADPPASCRYCGALTDSEAHTPGCPSGGGPAPGRPLSRRNLVLVVVEEYVGDDTGCGLDGAEWDQRANCRVLWAVGKLEGDGVVRLIDNGYRSEAEIRDAWGDRLDGAR